MACLTMIIFFISQWLQRFRSCFPELTSSFLPRKRGGYGRNQNYIDDIEKRVTNCDEIWKRLAHVHILLSSISETVTHLVETVRIAMYRFLHSLKPNNLINLHTHRFDMDIYPINLKSLFRRNSDLRVKWISNLDNLEILIFLNFECRQLFFFQSRCRVNITN
jgi:hypothetical protein